MNAFLHRHADNITGTLSGLDRIVFRGTLREIAYAGGLDKCLTMERVLLKDFAAFTKARSGELVTATKDFTENVCGRQFVWLPSPNVEKEDLALGIAAEERITSGLICVLKSVEPCRTFCIRKDREKRRIELVASDRKCAFLYHYAMHPDFGFMNARIQTWFPFTIQVCINGRTWLARQMDKAGIGYVRADNTFTSVDDLPRAQQLMDQQIRSDFQALLEGIARRIFPRYPKLFSRFETRYNWTVYQSEVATDLMFEDATTLRPLYRPLTLQAISLFGSRDTIRFLGQNHVRLDGKIRADFEGEVTSSYKERPEGVRVKHGVNGNSVKIYDKAGSVLRVETTINRPRDFKVMRPKEGGDPTDVQRRYLRQGVEDLSRRVEVSRGCNDRYLDALATISRTEPETLEQTTASLARPAVIGKSYARGLNPHRVEDAALFAVVNRAEFVINGFRNADVLAVLYGPVHDVKERRRVSARVTRRLRILRAHALIERIAGTNRYQVTDSGRTKIVAVLAALHANVSLLLSAA